ncbi:sulfurtransferase [Neobacillus kokaensis]|uniref:Thiosulfate sulfurtransferase n=1 Tax=Neobacillus kokaensis TaxID=2759023 RepID=A0ABQ3N322_9BACI|nr:sulfurtransferase [Neobacillus kokaensis]GHH98250.1 thiosulfate sulfurtransferase [Neobacillus kokaensis]
MKNIVDKEWLLNQIHNSKIRIVDCRFSLAEKEKGRQEYEESHIPGAVFLDIEKDLSSAVGMHGGRHPMPNLEVLISKLEKAGINENVSVVAYDNGEGAFAGRFWWLLQYLGHDDVFVLNGGFKQWKEANYPVTSAEPTFEKVEFHGCAREELLADVEEVRAVSTGKTDAVLIDSREAKRYLGIEEPIDKKAGHIPGAINKPFLECFSAGQFKSVEEQKERFADIDPEKQIIVYCGSGITATPNYMALKEAGFEKVKLYLGSFSDWISYEENKID